MSAAPGYNPLRWSCEARGCFNEKQRPKIEIFAECFPGKIAMTDVDATVEVNGHFLFLEFKGGIPRDLPIGQQIYFERLTSLSKNITCVVTWGDAETMKVWAYLAIHGGHIYPRQEVTTDQLKERLRVWVQKALRPANDEAA